MTDASARGRASKRKGKRGELYVYNELRTAVPPEYQVYHSGMMQGRGGLSTPDVGIYKDGRCILHIEVKNQKQPNIHATMEQAIADTALSHAIAVAATRRTQKYGKRNPFLVTVELKHFAELLLAWLELNK